MLHLIKDNNLNDFSKKFFFFRFALISYFRVKILTFLSTHTLKQANLKYNKHISFFSGNTLNV